VTSDTIAHPCIVLVGPTAIGKTELSLNIARKYDCEIVSVDSMQVYRYMDIGTAKASAQERTEIPHHLIDIVDPDENYDAARFVKDSLRAINDIHARGKTPLLTGGTGLYLRSLYEGLFQGVPVDENIRQILRERLRSEGANKLHEELSLCDSISAKRIHKNDSQRLLRALEIFYSSGTPWSEHIKAHRKKCFGKLEADTLKIGLTTDRQHLYERIDSRCAAMLNQGLEDEVRDLLARGYDRTLKVFGAIGYRHLLNYIEGHWSKEETIRLLARDTRRYAKRQYTWFSRISDLQWFDIEEKHRILRSVENWFVDQKKVTNE